MPYPQFDRSKLKLLPLTERVHDMHMDEMIDPNAPATGYHHDTVALLSRRVKVARDAGKPVILMMGAHVIKTGLSRVLIKLMEEGYISHIAMNGACAIHDFELSLIGETTESVAKYISEGQFGLWNETGIINDVAKTAAGEGIGLGEALGRYMESTNPPHKDISVIAAAYRLGIPATVHVGIGCDIIHEHPNFDGAATGEATYADFLVYAHIIQDLEGGVFLNFGSAVFGPEVYLKCLSMARNVACQEGKQIAHFTTAVFDMLPLEGEDLHSTPPKSDARYYFRPWKTILARTVADGGESYYVCGEHANTLPYLLQSLRAL